MVPASEDSSSSVITGDRKSEMLLEDAVRPAGLRGNFSALNLTALATGSADEETSREGHSLEDRSISILQTLSDSYPDTMLSTVKPVGAPHSPSNRRLRTKQNFSSAIDSAGPVTSVRLPTPPLQMDQSVLSWIKGGKVDLVINIPEGTTRREEVTSGYLMRRAAVDFGISLLTNIKCAVLFCDALHRNKSLPCISAEEFLAGTAGK